MSGRQVTYSLVRTHSLVDVVRVGRTQAMSDSIQRVTYSQLPAAARPLPLTM